MAHKHSVVVKGEVEFFVKKAGKSFGVEIKDAKGNVITKLYGSLNRNAYRQDFSIGDMIENKGKVVFKKISKVTKSSQKEEKVARKSSKSVQGDVEGLATDIASAFARFMK